ncbi:hypothetical protein BS47DRAFT_1484140 [Hydnum rufescens UP504]|uniref:Uncharacterized protein n=1 Tax=Hydnum rufescens UP504 TaxID=1448309 RepID=A0A9P6B1Y9_9AGAM|nr:hypothetical protein BS47DRAFT_1484140 [Hydnum rufescens UP504]
MELAEHVPIGILDSVYGRETRSTSSPTVKRESRDDAYHSREPYGAGAFAIRVLSNLLCIFHGPVLMVAWQLRTGHAEVSANIKKVGPKLATQRILLALTEKGEITQKSHGAQINLLGRQAGYTVLATLECKQSDEDDMPTEKADELQKEVDQSKEENKGTHDLESTPHEGCALNSRSNVPSRVSESIRIRLIPTTNSLPALISTLRSSLEGLDGVLAPYHISFADAPIPEAKDVERLDVDWARWRKEQKKHKIFKELRCFIRLTPRAFVPRSLHDSLISWICLSNEAGMINTIPADLLSILQFSFHRIWPSITAESLGIEFDSEEHETLERGPLCQPPARHTGPQARRLNTKVRPEHF